MNLKLPQTQLAKSRAVRRMPNAALSTADALLDTLAPRKVLLHAPVHNARVHPVNSDAWRNLALYTQIFPVNNKNVLPPTCVEMTRATLGSVLLLSLPAPPHPFKCLADGSELRVLGDGALSLVTPHDIRFCGLKGHLVLLGSLAGPMAWGVATDDAYFNDSDLPVRQSHENPLQQSNALVVPVLLAALICKEGAQQVLWHDVCGGEQPEWGQPGLAALEPYAASAAGLDASALDNGLPMLGSLLPGQGEMHRGLLRALLAYTREHVASDGSVANAHVLAVLRGALEGRVCAPGRAWNGKDGTGKDGRLVMRRTTNSKAPYLNNTAHNALAFADYSITRCTAFQPLAPMPPPK